MTTRNIMLLFLLGAATSALGQDIMSTHNAELLREACVAFERTQVAQDANDFTHLKDTDWTSAGWCRGVIQGFEIGANHTIYVLAEPKRLEILSSQHSIREMAKALVTYVDAHPDETELRTIIVNALQKAGILILFAPSVPDCPKNMKDVPAAEFGKKFPDGCTVR
ncbi:MAG: hypothetical protein WAM04_14545 [Candidatus Sulfotelmatobacter sp.]